MGNLRATAKNLVAPARCSGGVAPLPAATPAAGDPAATNPGSEAEKMASAGAGE